MARATQKPARMPPTAVVRRAVALRSRVRRMADAMLPPQGLAAERTFLLAEIKMLGVVCELGGPRRHGRRRRPVGRHRAGGRRGRLERVLRFLALPGLVHPHAGRPLPAQRPVPRPAERRPAVAAGLGALHGGRLALEHLELRARAGPGRRSAAGARGKPFFDWVHDDDPAAGTTFDAAMRSLSSVAGPLVVEAVDLDGVATICDVGGGTGRLLRALLDAAPAARGTVFDLAEVVSGAGEVLGDLPDDRWQAVAGSFFEPGAVPAGHDRYVMQAIAHDWGDEQAGAILRNVRAAMAPGARVWLVDSILDPSERDESPARAKAMTAAPRLLRSVAAQVIASRRYVSLRRRRTPDGVPPPEVTTAVRAPATWRSPASWRSWAIAS